MIVRQAVPGDRPFVLRLTEELGAFPVPRWRTAAEIASADHEILGRALEVPRGDQSLLVAEEGGEPWGYIFTSTRDDYFTRERHAHVEVIAVAGGARRRGVGQRLMLAAEDWARSQGYRRITLNVFERNTGACRFYEGLGYEPETVHYLKEL
ncbi:MAG TPA: GNAT family N-acetyltransferase [Gemmatimonadales bacterium]|nr:GNAT family N-acetyltransferase [Gemmatimonadales bacterium]